MEPNAKILDKITKLLKLSEDRAATEAEAENAMAMASALMAKHGIDQAAIHGHNAADVNLGVAWETKRQEAYKYWCVAAAGRLNGCETWWSTGSIGTRYIICGPKESREAAKILAKYLLDQVEKMYKINLPRGLSVSARANFRRTFKYACAKRLLQRAEEIVEKMKREGLPEQQCTALVVADHFTNQLTEIGNWMESEGFNIRQTKTRHKLGSGTIAGRQAGDQIRIQPNLQ